MTNSRMVVLPVVLAACGLVSLASFNPPDPDPVPEPIEIDATWMVANLYDGQTAVDTDITIRLTVGTRDLWGNADPEQALRSIRFCRTEDGRDAPFEVAVGATSTDVWVPGGLMRDTDYVLDLANLSAWLSTRRWIPEPIRFSTRSAPQVIGLWQNEDTLIIEFSEPMDPQTLFVHQTSFDLLWQEGMEVRSLAADSNVASYVWDTRGPLFMVAPINFAGSTSSFWIKITDCVRAATGAALDGDGDGQPGEETDDYLWEVPSFVFPTCYTREDIPHPCLEEDQIPPSWWG